MSTTHKIPTYENVFSALSKVKASTSPSEAHGLLCGIICGFGDEEENLLFNKFFGLDESDELFGYLCDVYKATSEQLKSTELNFDLLLPEDEEPLPNRVDALREWCQGFLIGLETVEFQEDENQSLEAEEALMDLTEFSVMEFSPVGDQNEDEEAYQEILEFVKVAVLLLYTEYVLMPLKTDDEVLH